MKQIKTELLIIGGGINGLATARMAAANGISCLLLEKGDLCSGTSNASSKLVHGGLRYLEHYDFRLVREAAIERGRLLKCAPHLVQENRFLFPNCEQNQHGRFATKMGIWLYEVLAGKFSLHPHRWIKEVELKNREPDFLPQRELGAYEYSDCAMDDAALAISTALDAHNLGAQLMNYQEVIHLNRVSEDWICHTKSHMVTEPDLQVKASKVILALGPWTDLLLKKWAIPSPKLLQLSQGAHLYVQKLPIQTSFILPVPQSQRYFFVLPWKDGHLIGTTETPILNSKQIPPEVEKQEVGELLYLLATYFPNLSPKVISTIVGIRPLALKSPQNTENADEKFDSTVQTSRQHLFHHLHKNLLVGVGGKWTTQRLFAQDILKQSGYHIHDPLIDRTYPKIRTFPSTLAASSLDLIKEHILYSCEKTFCKHPLDYIRNRSDLYFSSDGGRALWEVIEGVFKEFYPLEDSRQWYRDYLNYLKINQHQVMESIED